MPRTKGAKDAKKDREKRDAKRRENLKAKDAQRKRLIAAGLTLGYNDARIAAGIGVPVQLLHDTYGDLIRAGRDGQAMKVTATLHELANGGDTKAAIALMKALEPKQFNPPRPDWVDERVPVELVMVFTHEPKQVGRTPQPEQPQRLGITIDGSGVVVSGG